MDSIRVFFFLAQVVSVKNSPSLCHYPTGNEHLHVDWRKISPKSPSCELNKKNTCFKVCPLQSL